MASEFHEVVIEGPRGWALGFVEGYVLGKGCQGRMFDAEQEGFDVTPMRERIRELLSHAVETSHLLVTPETLAEIREAVGSAATKGLKITIRHERRIASASFGFEFEAYTAELADRARACVDPPPDGATLSPETRFDVRSDPSAKGIEAYAPAHEYEMRARGTVEGKLEAVLTTHRRCRDNELLRVTEIRLHEE